MVDYKRKLPLIKIRNHPKEVLYIVLKQVYRLILEDLIYFLLGISFLKLITAGHPQPVAFF